MERTRINTENTKRRIAMRNRRRWKKVMEDIGILRDVFCEVCKRLTMVEKKTRKEREDDEYFSCEEGSEEGQEIEEMEDGTGGAQKKNRKDQCPCQAVKKVQRIWTNQLSKTRVKKTYSCQIQNWMKKK
eukprot:TRINITY_DN5206_c0_g1_i6.p1 TRINITY_DN5206_c0_g1~~TRINITY_DN5206_c0_g1_i6.p1  ORF type:complete len:129 (+),score=33.76 TRINITY_DN5206_c0_g1_i6:121-507(+)